MEEVDEQNMLNNILKTSQIYENQKIQIFRNNPTLNYLHFLGESCWINLRYYVTWCLFVLLYGCKTCKVTRRGEEMSTERVKRDESFGRRIELDGRSLLTRRENYL